MALTITASQLAKVRAALAAGPTRCGIEALGRCPRGVRAGRTVGVARACRAAPEDAATPPLDRSERHVSSRGIRRAVRSRGGARPRTILSRPGKPGPADAGSPSGPSAAVAARGRGGGGAARVRGRRSGRSARFSRNWGARTRVVAAAARGRRPCPAGAGPRAATARSRGPRAGAAAHVLPRLVPGVCGMRRGAAASTVLQPIGHGGARVVARRRTAPGGRPSHRVVTAGPRRGTAPPTDTSVRVACPARCGEVSHRVLTVRSKPLIWHVLRGPCRACATSGAAAPRNALGID